MAFGGSDLREAFSAGLAAKTFLLRVDNLVDSELTSTWEVLLAQTTAKWSYARMNLPMAPKIIQYREELVANVALVRLLVRVNPHGVLLEIAFMCKGLFTLIAFEQFLLTMG